jgi:hypothetical protein
MAAYRPHVGSINSVLEGTGVGCTTVHNINIPTIYSRVGIAKVDSVIETIPVGRGPWNKKTGLLIQTIMNCM